MHKKFFLLVLIITLISVISLVIFFYLNFKSGKLQKFLINTVVKMENGKPQILKVEGTEILDGKSPQFDSIPPIQLTKNLKIETWKFRDSNWSPDFGVSTQKALELYEKENGLEAKQIDAVIGITPTVFENILQILGPIAINGIEFNYDNFTEKLEYEVEYGYNEKGIDFRERKKLWGV